MAPTGRTPFTASDSTNLTKFLAVYCPTSNGRMGNKVYKDLVENAEGRWSWASRHPWSSWRDHYKNNSTDFDVHIRKYQLKKGLLKKKPAILPQQPDTDNLTRPREAEKTKRKASSTLESSPVAKRPKPSKEATRGLVNGIKVEEENTLPKKPVVAVDSETEDDDGSVHHKIYKPQEEEENMEEDGEVNKVSINGRSEAPGDDSIADMGILSNGRAWERGQVPSDLKTQASPSKVVNALTLPSQSGATNGVGSLENSETHSGPLAKPKPKPRLLQRKPVDDDPFLSTPNQSPAPIAISPTHTLRKPPVYKEGPYRGAIDVGQAKTWPPKREKRSTSVAPAPPTSSAVQMPPPMAVVRKSGGSSLKKAGPLAIPPPISAAVPQFVVVDTVASSSKTQLPPSKYKSVDDAISLNGSTSLPKPTDSMYPDLSPFKIDPSAFPSKFARKTSTGNSQRGNEPRQDATTSPHSHVHYARDVRPSESSSIEQPLPRLNDVFGRRESGGNTGGSTTFTDNSADTHPSTTVTDANVPAEGRRKSDEPRRPLLANEVRRKLYSMEHAAIPQIDLRVVSSGSRRQSSVSSSAKTASSTREKMDADRRRSRSFVITPPQQGAAPFTATRRSSSMASSKDLQLFQDAGHKLLAGVAQRYGFDVNVALKAYEKFQDLDLTGAFLSKLRDRSELAGRDLLKEMQGDTRRESDSENEDALSGSGYDVEGEEVRVVPRVKRRVNREAQIHSRDDHHRAHQHSRRSSGTSQSLSIRPITDENDGNMSDYKPPRKSRAGRYSRLARRDPASASRRGTSTATATPAGRVWEPVVMPFSQNPIDRLTEARHERDYMLGSSGGIGGAGVERRGGGTIRQPSRPALNDGSPLYREGGRGRGRAHSPFFAQAPLLPSRSEHRNPETLISPSPPTVDDDDGNDDDDLEVTAAREESVGREEQGSGSTTDVGNALEPGTPEELETEDESAKKEDDEDEYEGQQKQAMDVDESSLTLSLPKLDPKDYFAALPPQQLEKQRELIMFATTVNRANVDQMREWEAKQDAEMLREHQAFLLETLRHRIEAGEADPFNFDSYFE